MRDASLLDDSRYMAGLVLIVLAAAFGVRAWDIGYPLPWQDEVHSMLYARHSVAHLLDPGRTSDLHPPLFFLSLKGWIAVFGDSREMARIFSALVGTVCVGLVFLIARRLFGTVTALVAAGLLATFPIAVHYAREIRMYPMFSMFFLLSLLSALPLIYAGRPGQNPDRPLLWPMLGFAVALALTFYTHYTSALLYMLYTMLALILLAMGQIRSFVWLVVGLALATALVAPQIYHILTVSFGYSTKEWMEPTDLWVFYATTMGAYPYAPLLKLVVFAGIAAGLVLMWQRQPFEAMLMLIFSAAGMVLAAVIGLFEAIYLIRTIQVFTACSVIFLAYLVVRLPLWPAVAVAFGLSAINISTVSERSYMEARQSLPAELLAPFVALLNADKDVVYAKDYLEPQMRMLHVPLFETARAISLSGAQAEAADLERAITCLNNAGSDGCRSVVLIVEQDSRFEKEAIATWNAAADALRASAPAVLEDVVAGYRVVIASQDGAFLDTARSTLPHPF